MTADTRLCTLSHFDLDRRARLEVVAVHAEASGGDLYDRVVSVAVEILMKSALARVVEGAHFLRRACKTCVCVIADRAVGHRGKHYRQLKLELRRKRIDKVSGGVALYVLRLRAEEHSRFHRLAERIYRGICHLGCVDQYLVPIHRQRCGISHGRKENSSALCLKIHLFHELRAPVCVFAEGVCAFLDLQRAARAKRNASLAIDALRAVAYHYPALGIKGMNLVRALPLADAAGDAPVLIADDLKFRIYVIYTHGITSLQARR